MAYALGKHLKLPTINVDHAIVQALCDTDIPAKHLLVSAIAENYEMIKKHTRDDSDPSPEHEQGYQL